ncbi:MAG: glycosyltransferase, partial [Ktedonobacteraceae bacterium]|nr:glycosyltransferase [Ktedonobacteraceae bacterium]
TLMMRCLGSYEARRARSCEARQLRRFQQVLVTSERERLALLDTVALSKSGGHAPINVLTHGVDRGYFHTYHGPRQADLLVFSGKMSFHANVAGALHMVKHILPRIWSQRPNTRLVIAGAHPPLALRKLARDPRIEITGYRPDLRPYLARAQVAVCPLPYAVGVQNKALEAMAMGTPVVATSCVAAGLPVVAGRDLLVADEPEAFANAVLHLLEDGAYREQLAHQGLAYINTYHDWDHIIQELIAIYQNAVQNN